MELINRVCFQTFPVKDNEYIDDDLNYILFEFNMNYTVDSVRSVYHENRNNTVSDDILRELGYDDEDIMRCHDD